MDDKLDQSVQLVKLAPLIKDSKPDIVFVKQKIAVFVDGEFWHGKKFNSWKNKLI